MKDLNNYIIEKLNNKDANDYEDIIVMICDIFDPSDFDDFSENLVNALKQIGVNNLNELRIKTEKENNKYDRSDKIKEYKDQIEIDSNVSDFYHDSYNYFNCIYTKNNLSISLIFEDSEKKNNKAKPFAFIVTDSNWLGSLELYFEKK